MIVGTLSVGVLVATIECSFGLQADQADANTEL